MEKEILRLDCCEKRFPALLLRLVCVLLRAPLVLLDSNDSDESSEVCCCCCFCSSEVLDAS